MLSFNMSCSDHQWYYIAGTSEAGRVERTQKLDSVQALVALEDIDSWQEILMDYRNNACKAWDA